MSQQGGTRLIEGQLQSVLKGVVNALGGLAQLPGGKGKPALSLVVGPLDHSFKDTFICCQSQGKASKGPLFQSMGGLRRVFRFLTREEGEHHLLGGIVISLRLPEGGVRLKIELQWAIASRI